MYTTLELLKDTDACRPGFGRMMRFFGLKYDRKAKIPLHVIALIGGLSDVEWVLSTALIIDPQEFQEFYRRTLPAYLKLSIKEHCVNSTLNQIASLRHLPGHNMRGYYPGQDLDDVTKSAILDLKPEKSTKTLKREAYVKLWHLCGFDNPHFTQPSHEKFLEFIDYAHSLPNGIMGSYFDRFLRVITANPNEYIASVLSYHSAACLSREFITVNDTNIFGMPKHTTPATKAAYLFKPEGTFDFLTEIDHRMPPNLKFEMLPNNRVRVVREFDIASLDYVHLLRSTSSVQDQDIMDTESNTHYPEYFMTTEVVGDSMQEVFAIKDEIDDEEAYEDPEEDDADSTEYE